LDVDDWGCDFMNCIEIIAALEQSDLSKTGIALQLGVSYWTVLRWAKGVRSPQAGHLRRMQALLQERAHL
jgi:DNA-binding transcriptional regulator YiaG